MQCLAPHKYKSYGEKDNDDITTMISTPPTKYDDEKKNNGNDIKSRKLLASE